MKKYLHPLLASPQCGDLRTVAFHEAGHAVVMHFNGRGPLYVAVLRKPDGYAGSTWPNESVDPNPFDAGTIGQEVEVALAGPLAEELHTGHWDDDGATGDVSHAMDLVRSAVCSSAADSKAYLERARDRITEFLKVPAVWAAVSRLAAALVEEGKLRPVAGGFIEERMLRAERVGELILKNNRGETPPALNEAYELLCARRNHDGGQRDCESHAL